MGESFWSGLFPYQFEDLERIIMGEYFTIRWVDDVVRMLDQRLLPQQEIYRDFSDCQEVASAITAMVIRGAPAIGVAAAYGMALAALKSSATSLESWLNELHFAAKELQAARPTAINLSWAVKRILSEVEKHQSEGVPALKEVVVRTAFEIADEDIKVNKKIGQIGASLIHDGGNVIHHCNTGALATADYGTALGVIRAAHEAGKNIHVYVDETRPRLQGARLTSWELKKLGIPHTVIVDSASGHIMRTRHIDMCLVGCDRIAANGDVANKIGTYNLALVANAHQVPFYSAGPISTLDLNTFTGEDIPIEERDPIEISHIGGYQITPDDVQIANPAFDITPSRYITGIITERGIARAPYLESLVRLSEGGEWI
jgi:methylthioribose-1-phosphate isomerase